MASPGVDKKSENRPARYQGGRALSGPAGGVANEQIPYSTVNSKEDEYPRKQKIVH